MRIEMRIFEIYQRLFQKISQNTTFENYNVTIELQSLNINSSQLYTRAFENDDIQKKNNKYISDAETDFTLVVMKSK